MSSASYIRFELLRTFRNRRFFLFSFGFPLVLYFLIAGPNGHVHSLNRKRHAYLHLEGRGDCSGHWRHSHHFTAAWVTHDYPDCFIFGWRF